MKRVLAILLTALMIVSLAACGAENGESTSGPASEPEPVQTSEADPGQTGEASPASSDPAETEGKPASGNPLEGTGFVMPDAATRNYDVQCVEYEVIDGAPEDGYEKKIVVYYETPEDAARALSLRPAHGSIQAPVLFLRNGRAHRKLQSPRHRLLPYIRLFWYRANSNAPDLLQGSLAPRIRNKYRVYCRLAFAKALSLRRAKRQGDLR